MRWSRLSGATVFIATFVFIWLLGDVPRWMSALNGASIVALLLSTVCYELWKAAHLLATGIGGGIEREPDLDPPHPGHVMRGGAENRGPRPDCPDCAKPGFSSG